MSALKFKPRFAYDPNYTGCTGEVNDQPSMTVPDQALSLQTLLKNHTRGIPSNVAMRDGQYLGTVIPNITDLNDISELRESLAQREKELNEELKAEYDENQSKKKRAPKKGDHNPDNDREGDPEPQEKELKT